MIASIDKLTDEFQNITIIRDKRGNKKCEHGKRRSLCRECGGGAICGHDRVRSKCRECGGGSICEHGRRRSECRECGGSSICEHDRVRSQCRECGGSSICEHGKQRSICRECGGSSICEHGKRRSYCGDCSHTATQNNLPKPNRICKTHGCDTQGRSHYHGYCAKCWQKLPENMGIVFKRNYKTKEIRVVELIKTRYPTLDWRHDKTVECGCNNRRPDMYVDLYRCVLIIEIDEHQHRNETSCDYVRISELYETFGCRTLVFIRFNPDGYINSRGKKITSPWKPPTGSNIIDISKKHEEAWNARILCLFNMIDLALSRVPYWDLGIVEYVHLYYDGWYD